MEKTKNSITRKEELQNLAGQIVSQWPESMKDISPEDLKILIHEFAVCQVESEIQDEGLRKSRLETEAAHRKYHDLYNFAPVGYLTIGHNGLIIEINLTGADLLGSERHHLINKKFSQFIMPESQNVFYQHQQQILDSGKKQTCELKLQKNDGTPFYALMECVPAMDDKGDLTQIHSTMADITRRKQAENALEEERQRLFSVLDLIPAFVYVLSPDYTISFANKNFCQLFGDPGDRRCYEIFNGLQSPCESCPTRNVIETKKPQTREWDLTPGRCFLIYNDLLPGADCEDSVLGLGFDLSDLRKAEEAIHKSEEKYRNLFEQMPSGVAVLEAVDNGADFIFKDFNRAGEKIDKLKRDDLIGRRITEAFPGIRDFGMFEVFQQAYRTGNPEYVPEARYTNNLIPEVWRENWVYKLPTNEIIVIYNDVSERKKTQDLIHRLSHELIRHQEKERHMISLELHDTVAQDLISLKIASDLFFREFQDAPAKIKERFFNFSKILQKSIDKIRNISYDLRPPGLEDYGIVNILDGYAHEFSEQTGLHVDFFHDGVKDQRFNYNIEINLYRLVQEGLNNIKKHADASHATIRLLATYPNLVLCIEDDGKGFDIEKYRKREPKEKRLGLRSMEERARLLNGSMTIEATPRSGTKVRIEIPFEEKEDDR